MPNFRLQLDNNYLVGKYSQHSEQLQNEFINLPDTVEVIYIRLIYYRICIQPFFCVQELHELLLQRHEELIIAKIGKEKAEEDVNAHKSKIVILLDKLNEEQHLRDAHEKNYVGEIEIIKY